MTPADAQGIQQDARARGVWVMWFVSTSDPDHPNKAVAWAQTADPYGGERLPGTLVAGTLDELRSMLPPGLTRAKQSSVLATDVLETWD